MWIQKVAGGGVTALAYSPDGATLYTADSSGWITAWDVASRTGSKFVSDARLTSPSLPRLYALADGKRLATHIGPRGLYDLATKKLRLGANPFQQIEFVPTCTLSDGRMYGYDPDRAAIGGWNLTTDQPEPIRLVPESGSPIRSFDLSPDERWAVVVNWGYGAVLYKWGDGPELQSILILPTEWFTSEARFSPDSRTLAVAHDEAIALLDVETHQFRGERIPCWLDQRFTFNPVRPLFASVDRDDTFTVFSLETGSPIRSCDFALGRNILCAAFSPDGLTCAVGGSNKQFAVFDVDV